MDMTYSSIVFAGMAGASVAPRTPELHGHPEVRSGTDSTGSGHR
ncbi:MAG: hypothetical protein SOZ03_05530 [Eubacteriales bacterium]|nr:hypothetical protein [Eubacteriales bacterium]